jgi:hypothetical protein
MTAAEMADEDFRYNALSEFPAQTGLAESDVVFSKVAQNVADQGVYEYIVARPVHAPRGRREPFPDRWWVYDADLDESECWVGQATFTPRGFINRPDDERFALFDDAADAREQNLLGPDSGRIDLGLPGATANADPSERLRAVLRQLGHSDEQVAHIEATARATRMEFPEDERRDEDDGEDTGGMFPAWEGRVTHDEPSAPRDPTAPVTATIDLEDHEVAEREGIGTWEEHGQYGVLMTDNGFAVVLGGGSNSGIVRYPDKTACTVSGRNAQEARDQAEKFLAKRPYKTAAERILAGPDFDADDPVAEAPPEPTTAPAVDRPKPTKRVWSTTPITSGEDDD